MTHTDHSTTQAAKDEASGVAQTAAQRGGQVGETAGEQARRVADETTRQARDLAHEGRAQLLDQAKEGQRKAAESLNSLADQLQEMSDRSDGSGLAPEVVRQAADRTRTVASWLGDREPGALLDEVRSFARRRPGVFLAGAAMAGVLAGRLTRGAVAAAQDSGTGGTGDTGRGEPDSRQTYGTTRSATQTATEAATPAPSVTPPPPPVPPGNYGAPMPGSVTTPPQTQPNYPVPPPQPGAYPGPGR